MTVAFPSQDPEVEVERLRRATLFAGEAFGCVYEEDEPMPVLHDAAPDMRHFAEITGGAPIIPIR